MPLRVLIVSPFFPFPENMNGVNKINSHLLESNPYFDADILYLHIEGSQEFHQELMPPKQNKMIISHQKKRRFSRRNLLWWILGIYPYNVAKLRTSWEPLAKKIQQIEKDYHVIHLSSSALVPIVEALEEKIRKKVILFPIDCMTLYTERRLVQEKSKLLKFLLTYDLFVIRKFERKYLSKQFITVFVSEKDKERASSLTLKSNIYTISNGVDIEYFHPPLKILAEAPSLIFTGVMSYAPNRNAAYFLVNEVLPLLHQTNPNLHLYLIGREPDNELLKMKNKSLTVSGFVEDIRPFIEKSTLYISPLFFGSGIKNKVLEAMAMGKVVLGSTISFEGINGIPNEHFLVLEGDAQGWAKAIVQLIANPQSIVEIGKNARQLVETHYSWAAVRSQYGELYARCINNR